MNRDIGSLGEGFFDQLIVHTPGLVCNKVQADKRGWDFLVEFPSKSLNSLPLDMQPPPLSAFVQVKSTENRNLSPRIRLSNARRFLLRPDPCFFVLFVYEKGKREPFKAYLKHFWSELIEQTVRALRTAEKDGRTKLNLTMMPVNFDESHQISFDNISDQMLRAINDIKGHYASEKGRLTYFSGAEGGLGSCSLAFDESVSDDDLIDLALGLRASVPIDRFAPNSKRFGITLPLPGVRDGPGEISLEVKPSCSATLILSGQSFDDIIMPVDFYAPTAFPWIRHELIRYRIKNSFLDFIFHPASMTASKIEIDLPSGASLSIHDFERFLSLFVTLRGKSVTSQIWFEDSMKMWGTMEVPSIRPSEDITGWTAHLHFLRHFIEKASHFVEGVNLSQTQMIDASEEVFEFMFLLNSPTMNANGQIEKLPTLSAQYRIFHPLMVQVGLFCFCCLVSRLSTAICEEDERINISMSEPSHLASYILKANEGITAQLLADIEQRAKSFDGEVANIILAAPPLVRA
ncbi:MULTISPECIES: hypothetical protein [Rhizobium]|uniref:DUF4365 domain-containing protein n=1 Tax=Rhizobium rhododendri TaxID=2506430 RepID=A0ABY8IMD6_9HYPH|nr:MULTISPECIES: hypothetical protein [Rhizobium]MBZ5758061.1 hypothetical protein [Rhizobium sp. VS19-DR96]MBZ5765109.1 hypothetical protein [Rhizobium sp. VS19-DR129.2]MBZ5772652.1 hypothetical protein [Rhizobium sp. VS19-DRK62.2]MBZ5782661.1 hypothetical protein [Rhizobium sp. VS19-DR121]MBZ5800109.1 hypothetical protein [Rhizobium sp. VS19-DR181]